MGIHGPTLILQSPGKLNQATSVFVQSTIHRAKFPAAAPCTARNFKQKEASQREREVMSQKVKDLEVYLTLSELPKEFCFSAGVVILRPKRIGGWPVSP